LIKATGSIAELDDLRAIAESVKSGLLASQQRCMQALQDLERVFDGQSERQRPGMANA
jgi:hypothetical protein